MESPQELVARVASASLANDQRPPSTSPVLPTSELGQVTLTPPSKPSKTDWILDTTAATHIANDRSLFATFHAEDTEQDGEVETKSKGTEILQVLTRSREVVEHVLEDVEYVPSCPNNLVSLDKFFKSANVVRGAVDEDGVTFKTSKDVYKGHAVVRNGIFTLVLQSSRFEPVATPNPTSGLLPPTTEADFIEAFSTSVSNIQQGLTKVRQVLEEPLTLQGRTEAYKVIESMNGEIAPLNLSQGPEDEASRLVAGLRGIYCNKRLASAISQVAPILTGLSISEAVGFVSRSDQPVLYINLMNRIIKKECDGVDLLLVIKELATQTSTEHAPKHPAIDEYVRYKRDTRLGYHVPCHIRLTPPMNEEEAPDSDLKHDAAVVDGGGEEEVAAYEADNWAAA